MTSQTALPSDDSSKRNFKFLTLLTVLNVTFQLISDVTAGKIISVAGIGVSITVLYFPATYIMGDILTEVYGYSRARQVVWLTLLASVIAGISYQVVAIFPPASFFTADEAYRTVFFTVPRILLGGWIAVFLGDITNDFILAKLKVWSNGRHLWARLIGSTIGGQFVNTVVFYLIGLYGILPGSLLIQGMAVGWFIKTLVEFVMLPITYVVVRRLKAIEKIDYYDRDTNFNPFVVTSSK
ncbi:transporter [Bradyrhizobium nitroreducens]|uniref:Probable queuosine precursor transporter n=1 Tax=Bradyrhizobium nitroreducens TaxID=709803 RepID=A0A2M6UF72_9BRAD|nr:queuosine precursor transporter [Bradyrhizobium nitroreducens]PIT03262.1 transporter [Bradyrhizobium nitroreducens]